MRRFGQIVTLGVALAVTASLAVPAAAQNVENFEIKKFEADYFLSRNEQKTAIMNVIERIEVQFPDFDQNHGILRAIPQRYEGHTLSLSVESVKNDRGQPISYTTFSQNDNLVLKIGDADRYAHGAQTYVIRYTVRNVALNFVDHDELYWDVNGDQWRQNFGQVTARLHVQKGLASSLGSRQVCYAGAFGESSTGGCSIERTAGDSETVVISRTTEPLTAYETLTFVVDFEPGTFVPGPEIALEKRQENAKRAAAGAALLVPPVIAAAVMHNRWRKFGDDPKGRGTIVPEYQPPKSLDALAIDFLFKQELRSLAISALIIELATQKHLKIYEIPKKGWFGKKDFELEITGLPTNLATASKKALDMVFQKNLQIGAKVRISDFKHSSYRSQVSENFGQIANSLSKQLHDKGYFIKDPRAIKTAYRTWAILPAIAGCALIFLIFQNGLYPLAALGGGLVLTAVVMFFYSFFMPARTEKGVLVHDYMLGLQNYIKLAEADRLNFGQSPAGAQKIAASGFDPNDPKKQIKLFESLLPFAVLFGLEKQWAKQFESLYKKPPSWYSGDTAAFSAAHLASSVHDFSAAGSTSFSPPSSSGGSGFSGGSSGGGGGGGGGGGW